MAYSDFLKSVIGDIFSSQRSIKHFEMGMRENFKVIQIYNLFTTKGAKTTFQLSKVVSEIISLSNWLGF